MTPLTNYVYIPQFYLKKEKFWKENSTKEVLSILNWYSVYTFANLNMQGTRHFDRISISLRKSRILIRQWNFLFWNCLPAFLCEVLVNYASNMICIRLSNCTIFWKQQQFLHDHGNLQEHISVRAICSFIFSFLQIKTLVEIEKPCCYANESLYYFK